MYNFIFSPRIALQVILTIWRLNSFFVFNLQILKYYVYITSNGIIDYLADPGNEITSNSL